MENIIDVEKLKGIVTQELYDDGSIKECILNQMNEVKTSYGTHVPQYKDNGVQRKYIKSLSFYDRKSL